MKRLAAGALMADAIAATLAVAFLASAAHAAVSNFSPARSASKGPIEPPLDAPVVGEKLEYDVHWMTFHVGYGTLEVVEKMQYEGRDVYHLKAVARTNEVLSKLYPVEDEIHSYMDAETFHSLRFSKKLSEARYRADEEIRFDAAAKKGHYKSFKNGEEKTVEIPGPVHDLLSSFFWFRLQPVEVGKSLKTLVSSEEKVYDLELAIPSRQDKEIRNAGTLDTLLVEPKTRLKGILYSRGRAWVHFTADARRTPVLFTLKTPYGPVVGVLRLPRRR